jgi:hypothetical protein
MIPASNPGGNGEEEAPGICFIYGECNASFGVTKSFPNVRSEAMAFEDAESQLPILSKAQHCGR